MDSEQRLESLRQGAGRLVKIVSGQDPSEGQVEAMNTLLARTAELRRRFPGEVHLDFYDRWRTDPANEGAAQEYLALVEAS